MTHRFPIKEIARQAGLGTATVDRVLNDRDHVSPQTRARVAAALSELEAQERQLSARGRRLFVDVIVEAPHRFTRQLRAACDAVVPNLGMGVFRPRYTFHETMTEPEVIAILSRIRRRGSHGILLKARDLPSVAGMVDDLEAAGIPVVTIVTDIPNSARSAYVGIDNAKAGRTAAYLLAQVLGEDSGHVLTSRSQDEFEGEQLRFDNFREQFTRLCPGYKIIEASGGAGLSRNTAQMRGKLDEVSRVDAVYSMGGGNRGILDLLGEMNLQPRHFVAHDLDRDNVALLKAGAISFVLHHDLKADLEAAFQALAVRHGLAPDTEPSGQSDVQIVTPHNIPASVFAD